MCVSLFLRDKAARVKNATFAPLTAVCHCVYNNRSMMRSCLGSQVMPANIQFRVFTKCSRYGEEVCYKRDNSLPYQLTRYYQAVGGRAKCTASGMNDYC